LESLWRALAWPPLRFPARRLLAQGLAGSALTCLLCFSTGEGSFQPIKYVPYPIKKILDDEG
jgi:hypothetical protein